MAKKKAKPGTRRKTATSKTTTVIAAVEPVAAAVPEIRNQHGVERWPQPHAPNPAMLRNIMCIEGYTVYQWSDPPGTLYGMHKHESQQSHWIISGSLEITVQGRAAIILGPGDRDHMPANTYHAARVIGEEAVIYLIGEVFIEAGDRETS